MSRKLKKRSSIWSRTVRLREDDPRHERPDRLREPELVRDRGEPDEEAEDREQEELEREPVEQAVDGLRRASATRRGPR